MFWNKNHKEIYTEFIDSKTGKVIATSKMPIEQIPETFELNTSLDMPDGKYTVISADPINKSDFSKIGKLKLTLSKVEIINPADLLYSIPTIENTFFETMIDKKSNNYFKIHEDDWRQLELISADYNNEINKEFILIQNIYDKEMKGNFFKNLHVRDKIPSPLSIIKINYEKLLSYFNVKKKYDGFSLVNNQIASESYAFETNSNIIIFGTSENKIIKTICIKNLSNTDDIFKLCTDFKLILVDWIKMEKSLK